MDFHGWVSSATPILTAAALKIVGAVLLYMAGS